MIQRSISARTTTVSFLSHSLSRHATSFLLWFLLRTTGKNTQPWKHYNLNCMLQIVNQSCLFRLLFSSNIFDLFHILIFLDSGSAVSMIKLFLGTHWHGLNSQPLEFARVRNEVLNKTYLCPTTCICTYFHYSQENLQCHFVGLLHAACANSFLHF